MSTVDLTGRVALVTGGAGGIGAAVVRRLAKLGASVAVLDLNAAGAQRIASSVGGIAVVGDVTDPATMPAVVAQVEKEFGRLDVVHLNAGIGGGQAGVDGALDVERYRKLVGVNVDHVVYGVCAAVPALRRQGGGKIVITASLAGLVGMPADPLYTLTKHAVVGYTRAAGQARGDAPGAHGRLRRRSATIRAPTTTMISSIATPWTATPNWKIRRSPNSLPIFAPSITNAATNSE